MTVDASLYDRLGGAPAIDAAAELFYRKVLSDPVLEPYFADIDMDRQVAKQAAFLTLALGGAHQHPRRHPRTAPRAPPGPGDPAVDNGLAGLSPALRGTR